MKNIEKPLSKDDIVFTKEEVLSDYRIAHESRQASLIGRREVLTGKAKFGIFGDGKEIPQLAMAKVFQKGDWRSGYYRDQTFMLAAGMVSIEELFAQLYGDTDLKANPGNGGRLMNNHFATRTLDENGEWLNLSDLKNSSADTSPTASQMLRLVGLALASKHFRQDKNLAKYKNFSINGNEVAFGTIGDASTAEGHFFESINAAGVMQIPMAVSVWDDGWGISVPNKDQITKGNISEILKGFEKEEHTNGYYIYKVNAWDYPELVRVYKEGIAKCRKEHVPVLFHVMGCTQPQGHSTSGSHERYKSPDQLEEEEQRDGLVHFREWIIEQGLATAEELDAIEKAAKKRAREARKNAWNNFQQPIIDKQEELIRLVNLTSCNCAKTAKIETIKADLARIGEPIRKDVISAGRKILRLICDSCSDPTNSLKTNVSNWLEKEMKDGSDRYSSHLYSQSAYDAMKITPVPPAFGEKPELAPGREILRDNFDKIFETNPLVIAFGEDVGKIGGVNQTYEGLQEKYGTHRIYDTGIREATILGQGIGMAMRGLRPIAEIQYFDYLLYALQAISDDLATLHYRSKGGQKAPLIISTRGHRLEGIWHAGSPLSMVIDSIRGVHVAVPRNMTQAAGFYNTYLQSDQPVLIIEPLNGYRLHERKPINMGEFSIAPGQPEILKKGTDITVVTYGSCVRIAQDAVTQLQEFGIDVELIDAQTLIPFDVNSSILESLKKTNKILFFDEDVPSGATSYMMQQVIEIQKGFQYLDSEPRTLTAKAHRAAYSTDGDYFSNPNAEDVFDAVYNIMHEYNPKRFPKIF
ncbi:MAG: thiamine pyrophosphate-dependent enzyme [Bacteroidales bacterium]|jgi:pyruvate/2-oxoglutarate/acetoin dehydrogenase E1 component/TPP-dependent pyruvate/acetoin dehydrogenase alpha subunit|nr:thiamine pyrophosphate-dependent enzyme [Bacteroidales bacterium]MDD3701437.1 thiamine pyrophosphate-dependent enzyme [Bacteroidales bacterium]MDY0369488.1 thiamine pyrophosphate-dependent enzyme [Bacteroidales bacterium]